MEKILLVEDNKTLAKLIARKIKDALQFDVDVAYSLQEAKLFLKAYKYFICLLDLNLPDAPNGEVVDYVLKEENRVIVLSGNIDKEFRKKMLQKKIIDYVNKTGAENIDFIIHTIDRLKKNQQHKVLVVDDSMVFRNSMKEMLENLFFKVITVAHGEEALGMLEVHRDISLIIVDYFMPVMDGLEMTRQVRKKFKNNELNIMALSSNEESDVNAMFLKSGANDYIQKPFSKEEFSCRVNNSIEALENIHTITNNANRDYLTGLYNRRYFFSSMEIYLSNVLEYRENFALAMIDIDNFKNINDSHGHDIGDQAIVELSEVLRTNTNKHDIVSRFGGEEFCIVLKNTNKKEATNIFERLRDTVEKNIIHLDKEKLQFTVSIGVCTSNEYSLQETIHQADMMLYKAKHDGKNQVVMN